MSISTKVRVNTHYTRSVNLERDANVVAVTKNYIPTSRALRTFKRVVDTFSPEDVPRSWSWVGPYGSGKSSASAFLGQLLAGAGTEGNVVAQSVLAKASEDIAQDYQKANQAENGWLKVFLTGSPESMGKRLIKSLYGSAKAYWETLGFDVALLDGLKAIAQKDTVSTSEIVNAIQSTQTMLTDSGCPGILLIIDELGKFLEYEARHYGANDIYLLQALAEHAYKGQAVNLNIIVLLHQSFEQYAKGLGENLKNEWSKVQGRFEEIPFVESAEQVLRVVGSAFEQSVTPKEQKQLVVKTTDVVKCMVEQGALPAGLGSDDALDLYKSCYPLHPVSATLLPILCQKVAQNERTLFSYLGSSEEFGMLDMLNKLDEITDYVYPYHIYDYFITNQASSIGDYITHRRWAEVVTAIERLSSDDELDIKVLKTIGLLNIVGGKGGLKPSPALLMEMLPANHGDIEQSIKRLVEQSIVTFRRYSGEYRVWQGSDFDLEEALQIERGNLGKFALAEQLNKSSAMLPIVARRYTIENGALRYFQPLFIDAASYKKLPVDVDVPRVLFYLAGDKEDEGLFRKQVCNHFSDLDIVALCLNGTQLHEAVAETQALRLVRDSRPELHTDPVAKKEFDDRFTAAELAEAELLNDLLQNPETAVWYHNNIDLDVTSKRKLQEEMSSMLEVAYEKAPRLHNELINRDRPSSQAVSARNKLLAAMLSHADEEDLGIEKFPPEKAIYRSVLKQTGLHTYHKSKGKWVFQSPAISQRDDKESFNLLPAWTKINEFLANTEEKEASFIDLNDKLMAAPYGVKAGVLPILYFVAYLVNQHELAVFESRKYRPVFTQEMIERFLKAPGDFTFQRFRIDGLRASIFDQYTEVIHGDGKKRTLLELAKPLASFLGRLPDYTLKTQRGLSKQALDVRSAFNLAKSPEKLLLEELPKALGYAAVDSVSNDNELAGFSKDLRDVLRELNGAYSTLLERQRGMLETAFSLTADMTLENLRKVLTGKCHGLEAYTVDTKGARAFIMRITKSAGSDEEWLENVLMFLGHKPSSKWLDSDQDSAEFRLTDLSRRVLDLEKLSLYQRDKQRSVSGDFDVHLIRSVKKGGEVYDDVVAIDKNVASRIEPVVESITESLSSLNNRELVLAALAKVLDSHFDNNVDSEKTEGKGQRPKVLQES